MAFPTTPSNGDEYTNALGTVYKYLTADDKWYIINAPGGGLTFTLSADSTVIIWNTDGAANTNYQDIDLDSYFTVPANTVGAAIMIESKDGVLNLIYFGATETDNQNYTHYSQVVNTSLVDNIGFCPLAAGNIIKLKCVNTVPTAYTRLWIRVVGWWTT